VKNHVKQNRVILQGDNLHAEIICRSPANARCVLRVLKAAASGILIYSANRRHADAGCSE
jgi:hypothetical protein